MILITGPLFSGKRSAAKALLHWTDEELAQNAVRDAQELAAGCADLDALAQELAQKPVVIVTEVGGGVVPADPDERAAREAAGRLAERAETVIRVFCGIPTILKGGIAP